MIFFSGTIAFVVAGAGGVIIVADAVVAAPAFACKALLFFDKCRIEAGFLHREDVEDALVLRSALRNMERMNELTPILVL